MCIVIDANVMSNVFDTNSKNHADFKSVHEWIYKGKGKVVYGGTKYIDEIPQRFRGIFINLRKARKAILIPEIDVDNEVITVTKLGNTLSPKYNLDDQHIIALLRVSRCMLVCSEDVGLHKALRESSFFSPQKDRPKVYKTKKNKSLLVDSNISECCLPCVKTTNEQKSQLII